MFGLGRRQHPLGIVQPDPDPDVLTTAGRLARREGQILTIDHLTITALKAGVDTDLALDVRRALGLPMPSRARLAELDRKGGAR